MYPKNYHHHQILHELANLEPSCTGTTTGTKEVADEPTYIPITPKALTKTFEADLGQETGLRRMINRGIAIAPYYREGFAGQRTKIPKDLQR